MLLSGERHEMVAQLNDFLAGYEDFHDFNPRELFLVEALRTFTADSLFCLDCKPLARSGFPVAFPWFNTQHYWQDRILELREQIALMDEPPLLQGNF